MILDTFTGSKLWLNVVTEKGCFSDGKIVSQKCPNQVFIFTIFMIS
jgi:hypothetical protein